VIGKIEEEGRGEGGGGGGAYVTAKSKFSRLVLSSCKLRNFFHS
jgi:hypothetical protein